MFCPKCGKEIPNQLKFCPKCGAAVSDAAKTAKSPAEQAAQKKSATAAKPPKKGKKVLIAAAVAVALLFLIIRFSPQLEKDAGEEQTENPSTVQNEAGGGPSQDAEAQLLELVAQTEEMIRNRNQAVLVLEDLDLNEDYEGYLESIKQVAESLNASLADLAELREKADAISGLDSKMKSAKSEYFDMLYAAKSAHADAFAFLAECLEFFYDLFLPEIDGLGLDESIQFFDEWIQKTRTGHAAISCPVSAESEWKQLAEAMDYCESAIQKMADAIRYDDVLRSYSSDNLMSRWAAEWSKRIEKIMNCAAEEAAFADYQQEIASTLAEEMRAYAALDQKERNAYEFENICRGELVLDYETADTIYPSLYNTYDAFAIIKTGCISGTNSIVVEAEIEGFTQQYKETFDLDSSFRSIYIKPPALTGQLDLSVAKPAQLKITVSEKNGPLIEAKTFPVTLKSKNDFDWYSNDYGFSTQDNILCFLTPEASKIGDLKRLAADEIFDITGGQANSFSGYQNITSSKYATTYLQSAALMRALYDSGVRYVMNPKSTSGSAQHIQFPAEVLESRSGLCIETSLVVASALQSAGMHAFILLPPGHAQVAVEVWPGSGEYFLIETTMLEEASNNTKLFAENFWDLLEEGYAPSPNTAITYLDSTAWYDYLENTYDTIPYVIDCDDSLLLGMTPFAN